MPENTYTATPPDSYVSAAALQAGAEFVHFVVVGVGPHEKYGPAPIGLDQCWWCERAFNKEQSAIAVRFKEDGASGDVLGIHEPCAEEYRQRDEPTPIVVTLHTGGSVSVSGPPNAQVTVVDERADNTHTPTLEIVTCRNDDYGDALDVIIDGRRLGPDEFSWVNADPGRGWTTDEWQAWRDHATAEASPEAARLIAVHCERAEN